MVDESARSEGIIDRREERDIFDAMLTQEDGPKIFAITVQGLAGKSTLARHLSNYAAFERKVPAPYVRIEKGLDRVALVAQIGQELINRFQVEELANWEEANDALRSADFKSVQQPQAAPRAFKKGPGGFVEDAGQRSAGVSQADPVPRTRGKAERHCLGVFLEGLDAACRERPIAIILDQYDNRSDEINDWLIGPLCDRVFFSNGFGRLVLVIATRPGEKDPVPQLRGKLRERFSQFAVCRERLSEWNDDDVRQWLEQIGYSYDESEISAIRTWLKQKPVGHVRQLLSLKGMTVDQLEELSSSFRKDSV